MIIGAYIYTNSAFNRPNQNGATQSGANSTPLASEKENKRASTENIRPDISRVQEGNLDQFRKINAATESEKRNTTSSKSTIEIEEYRQAELVKYDPRAFQATQVFLEIQYAEEQERLIDVYA